MSMKGTILIADDEPHITYMLARKLEGVGFRVIVADNGSRALQLALKDPPDMIITDNQMPVLDGFDMCVRLRRHGPTATIPVIMLTARGHRLSEGEVQEAGITVLLPKPFSVKEILEHVHRLLPDIHERRAPGAAA